MDCGRLIILGGTFRLLEFLFRALIEEPKPTPDKDVQIDIVVAAVQAAIKATDEVGCTCKTKSKATCLEGPPQRIGLGPMWSRTTNKGEFWKATDTFNKNMNKIDYRNLPEVNKLRLIGEPGNSVEVTLDPDGTAIVEFKVSQPPKRRRAARK